MFYLKYFCQFFRDPPLGTFNIQFFGKGYAFCGSGLMPQIVAASYPPRRVWVPLGLAGVTLGWSPFEEDSRLPPFWGSQCAWQEANTGLSTLEVWAVASRALCPCPPKLGYFEVLLYQSGPDRKAENTPGISHIEIYQGDLSQKYLKNS